MNTNRYRGGLIFFGGLFISLSAHAQTETTISTDGDFDFDTIIKGKGKGPNRSYTVEETGGRSCEQIIELQDLVPGAGVDQSTFSGFIKTTDIVTPAALLFGTVSLFFPDAR